MTRWLLFLALLATPARAEVPADAVRAELLADAAAVAPGQTFTLGVLLHIPSGWHVYWKNPGDAGQATEVRFAAPDGFAVSGLRWPVPGSFVQAGDIRSFGYTDTLLLTSRITVPRTLRPGSQVVFHADVAWLCCRDICTPGEASLQLALPAADRPVPANADLFEQWERRLPVEAASSHSPLRVEVDGGSAATGPAKLLVRWQGARGSDVEFLPDPPAELQVQDVAIRPIAGGAEIAFRIDLLKGQKLASASLPGLVVYKDAGGQRRGVCICIPLRPFLRHIGARHASPSLVRQEDLPCAPVSS